jgi:hypothetical protein
VSLDLFLFPLDHLTIESIPPSGTRTLGYSHTVLNVSARRINDVRKMVAEPLPHGHNITGIVAKRGHGEPTYGEFTCDPYGAPYTWVRADKLAAVLRVALHGDRIDPTDAYIAALPGDTMVILGWH